MKKYKLTFICPKCGEKWKKESNSPGGISSCPRFFCTGKAPVYAVSLRMRMPTDDEDKFYTW